MSVSFYFIFFDFFLFFHLFVHIRKKSILLFSNVLFYMFSLTLWIFFFVNIIWLIFLILDVAFSLHLLVFIRYGWPFFLHMYCSFPDFYFPIDFFLYLPFFSNLLPHFYVFVSVLDYFLYTKFLNNKSGARIHVLIVSAQIYFYCDICEELIHFHSF